LPSSLIRLDQDRQQLRKLLLAGAGSDPGPVADDAYFTAVRRRLDRQR
jgi:antitoxin ParD1/3/4